jgi:hypothetical protein
MSVNIRHPRKRKEQLLESVEDVQRLGNTVTLRLSLLRGGKVSAANREVCGGVVSEKDERLGEQ